MTLTHVARAADRTPDAPEPGAKFLIPSLVWDGLAAEKQSIGAADGVAPLKDGWGGRIGSDEPLAPILKTLDLLLLLLNLAGYQVLEVAIGIPSGADETAGGDLIAIDLRTMTYARGTKRAWTPLGSSSAQVALCQGHRPVRPLPATAGRSRGRAERPAAQGVLGWKTPAEAMAEFLDSGLNGRKGQGGGWRRRSSPRGCRACYGAALRPQGCSAPPAAAACGAGLTPEPLRPLGGSNQGPGHRPAPGPARRLRTATS